MICKEICGDGKIVGNETCDDGTKDDFGCKDTCQGYRIGWRCLGGSSTKATVCSPICGDNKAVLATECDDGNPFDNQGCISDCSGVL